MISSLKAAAAVLILSASASAMSQQIQVQVDGNLVDFPNAHPHFENGRVLVPLRGVFEQMGATVDWDSDRQTVSATKDGNDIELRIGDHFARVNGSRVNLDAPAYLMHGSTMVPLRFISESLGARVGWVDEEHLVTIQDRTDRGEAAVDDRRERPSLRVRTNDVVAITLDRDVDGPDRRRGDTFSASVEAGRFGIPEGTKIEGHIAAVHSLAGGNHAKSELSFDRWRFPNGKTAPIDGQLTSLDDKYVRQGDDVRMVARQPQGRLVAGHMRYDNRGASELNLKGGTRIGVRINSGTSAGR